MPLMIPLNIFVASLLFSRAVLCHRYCALYIEAFMTLTHRHSQLYSKWGVQYYSTTNLHNVVSSWAWTFFYRNPTRVFPPSPPSSPPVPHPPSPPTPSLGFLVSQHYALTRYVHAVQSRRVNGTEETQHSGRKTPRPRLAIKFNGEAFMMQLPPQPGQPTSPCSALLGGCVEFRSCE